MPDGEAEPKTLAIVLGASRWPDCPKFIDAPSFSRAAEAIISFLRDRDGLDLPWSSIRSFFDSYESATDQLSAAARFIEDRRREFVEGNSRITDLFVFYVGHGDFEGEAKDFYLSIRRTHEDRPLISSITAYELGSFVRRYATGMRTYLIVDCCFAAALQHGFMSSALGLASQKLREVLPAPGAPPNSLADEIPRSGAALLAAAGMNDPASAPPDQLMTAFTTALLDVLRTGDEGLGRLLSLSDLHVLVRRRISELFKGVARPEMRPLHQSHGRIDLLGVFPNPARIRADRELAEARRLAEVEAAAQRRAAEAEARRLAEVEAATQRHAAEAEVGRIADETAAARRRAEEAEARRLADEATAAQLRAEEAEARRLADETAAAQRRAAEAEARQIADKQAAARRRSAEAAARLLADEEAVAQRRAAEAEARRVANEEAAMQLRAAETETRRIADHRAAAQRRAEEIEAQRTARKKAAARIWRNVLLTAIRIWRNVLLTAITLCLVVGLASIVWVEVQRQWKVQQEAAELDATQREASRVEAQRAADAAAARSRALAAMQAGRMEDAARDFKISATLGDATAQFWLGYFYNAGKGGLPVDRNLAARYYQLAADQGHADGQVNIGVFLERGEYGMASNIPRALSYYKRSAEQGNAFGQCMLGNLYLRGLGDIPKDVPEAERLFGLAAAQGVRPRRTAYGGCYSTPN